MRFYLLRIVCPIPSVYVFVFTIQTFSSYLYLRFTKEGQHALQSGGIVAAKYMRDVLNIVPCAKVAQGMALSIDKH